MKDEKKCGCGRDHEHDEHCGCGHHHHDDECGCGHDHDECDCGCDDECILTLTDQEGNSRDYYELAVFDADGEEYTIMQPVELDEGMEDNEVLIYRDVYDEDGNFVNYDPVFDPEVGDKVVETYNRMLEEGLEEEDGDAVLDDDDCGCGNDR